MTENMQNDQHALLISAYLDDELSEDKKQLVERLKDSDPEFHALFEQRKKQNGLMRDAFQQVDQQPMPESILAMLEDTGKVTPLPKKPSSFLVPVAMAASFLVVGILTLYLSGVGIKDSESISVTDLHAALDSQLSGTVIDIEHEQYDRLLVNLSFVDAEARYCREYFVAMGNAPAVQTVACKTGNTWVTEIEQISNKRLQYGVGSDRYQPASGEAENQIDQYLDKHMHSDPLDKEQEQEAVSTNWQRQSKAN